MNPQVFKIVHILAVLLLFYALGAIAVQSTGDRKADRPKMRLYMALHGLALLVILVTGLVQVHLLNTGFPTWLKIKFDVWLLLGGSVVLLVRKPQWRNWIWILLLALASVAVAAAVIR